MAEDPNTLETGSSVWIAARQGVASALWSNPPTPAPSAPRVSVWRSLVLLAWLALATAWYWKVLWDRWVD